MRQRGRGMPIASITTPIKAAHRGCLQDPRKQRIEVVIRNVVRRHGIISSYPAAAVEDAGLETADLAR
jgi:hypothetical protein